MKRKVIILEFACLGILFLCIFAPRYQIVEKITDDVNIIDRSFTFGLPEGLYTQDIVLELKTNFPGFSDVAIYYTIDGSMPTEASMKYETPLTFSLEGALKVIHIKAAVYRDHKKIAGPYEGTWLLSNDPGNLENMLIISIIADKEDLFGEEKGILYPAKSFISANTEEKWNEVHSQNFAQKGELWERTAQIEIYEGNGDLVVDQSCEISISGTHGSIMHYPFSLKVKAEDKERFYYSLFGEQNIGVSPYYYNSISLRNGGNDYVYGSLKTDLQGTMLRNTLGTKMAEELGLFTSKQRMALVFLNGEFYNLAYVNSNINGKTIAVKTNLKDDYVIVKKYGEKEAFTQSGMKKLYHSFPDMSDSHIFEKKEVFEQKIDVEDLFRYYSFECIAGNGDWPTKNYAMWKYIGNESEDNIYSDGRYRYWVFDLDCIYGLESWLPDPWEAIFENTVSENCLLPVLMQIDDYKVEFVNTVFDQLNSETFQEEHIIKMIDEENTRYGYWFCELYGEELENERQKGVDLLKENVCNRREQVFSYLNQYFDVEEAKLYTVDLLPADGLGMVHFNSIYLQNEGYEGIYDVNYPVKVQYMDSGVDTLDYFIVNGERIEDKELIITENMIQDGKVTIQMVIKNKRSAEILYGTEY